MIECCRFSYTGYTELMDLTVEEFFEFQNALYNVLERELESRKK